MPKTALDQVKLMVGMQQDNPPELLDELNDCFQLSRMQRLYGFAICISAGLFCSFLSSLMWTRPTKFAILYTMGNLLALGSTGFLTGFMAQFKGMMKGTRVVASCVYLGSLVRPSVRPSVCLYVRVVLSSTHFFCVLVRSLAQLLFLIHEWRRRTSQT